MSRALASLTPAWVTLKEVGVSGYAPALTGIYPHLAAVTEGVEDPGIVGHYTPLAGKTLPLNAAAFGGTAEPATDWDTGSYVDTLDGAGMHFVSAAWAAGAAP